MEDQEAIADGELAAAGYEDQPESYDEGVQETEGQAASTVEDTSDESLSGDPDRLLRDYKELQATRTRDLERFAEAQKDAEALGWLRQQEWFQNAYKSQYPSDEEKRQEETRGFEEQLADTGLDPAQLKALVDAQVQARMKEVDTWVAEQKAAADKATAQALLEKHPDAADYYDKMVEIDKRAPGLSLNELYNLASMEDKLKARAAATDESRRRAAGTHRPTNDSNASNTAEGLSPEEHFRMAWVEAGGAL